MLVVQGLDVPLFEVLGPGGEWSRHGGGRLNRSEGLKQRREEKERKKQRERENLKRSKGVWTVYGNNPVNARDAVV
jgi:hypothetical protein